MNNKPTFFTLKGEKKEVDNAFAALRTICEKEMTPSSTVLLHATDKSDTVTSYTIALSMSSHPFHRDLPRQMWEAKVNWDHRGFTVQYYYTMTTVGEDPTVYPDLLYFPSMKEMSVTMAVWNAFYCFVKDISVAVVDQEVSPLNQIK